MTITHNGVNEEISEMYKELTPEIISKLKEISNVEPLGMISASLNFKDRHKDGVGQMDHIIWVATTVKELPGFSCVDVPKQTWVVFTSEGPFPKNLQKHGLKYIVNGFQVQIIYLQEEPR